MTVKTGVKSQLFKFSSLRAETIEKVRERVFKIIRGKKLVGYHLPQKMVDFGLLEAGIAPETQFKWINILQLAIGQCSVPNPTNAANISTSSQSSEMR